MLAAGKADAFANDDVQLYGMLAETKSAADFRVVGDFLTYADYALMFRKDDPEFAEVVERAFHKLAGSREIVAIYERWFQKPLPSGVRLNLPMSPHLEELFRVQGLPSGLNHRAANRPSALAVAKHVRTRSTHMGILQRSRPGRDPGMGRFAARPSCSIKGVDRARFLLGATARGGARGSGRRRRSTLTTPYREHDPARNRRQSRPATASSSTRSARPSAGTRWRSSCARTRNRRSWAATSRASSPPRCSTTSASATSGTRRPTSTAATCIYVQGHVSPGIYARAFVEGRLTEQQLLELPAGERRQGHSVVSASVADAGFLAVPDGVDGPRPADGDLPGALPQVPARAAGSRRPTTARCGRSSATARCDEPESLGAISLAGREELDNLIFVINCNLQRLDGPVRGNGKIIQELEGVFRGAGWNVIKVVWGSGWDKLFAKDKDGILLKRMEECVDGQYQDFKSKNGAYVREHFFNTPELKALVADLSDDEVWKL